MIEKIGQVLCNFEEKYPILANITGIGAIYLLGLLMTLIVIYKVL